MTRQHRRKYRKVRNNFKKELYIACKTNKALAMLCIETYAAHQHRKHIMQIWYLLGRYHKEAHKDYCDKLIGKALTGEDEIFHSLYFAQKELYDKYNRKIPERVALGDALGNYKIRTVSKITPTERITMSDGSKYMPNGREIGGGRYDANLKKVTPEILDIIERRTLMYKLKFDKIVYL